MEVARDILDAIMSGHVEGLPDDDATMAEAEAEDEPRGGRRCDLMDSRSVAWRLLTHMAAAALCANDNHASMTEERGAMRSRLHLPCQ